MIKTYHFCLRTLFLYGIVILSVGCSTVNQKKESDRIIDVDDRAIQEIVAENAMVVSAHPIASEIGLQIIKNGGNAIDAAIATHFALAVAYPSAGNLGGGGFMVLRLQNGKTDALDFREVAPKAADRDMYLDKNGEVKEGKSLYGHLAAGVPGSVDGMIKAHERYGSIPLPKLIQPAIDLAKKGVLLTKKEAEKLNKHRENFIKYSSSPPKDFIRKKWKAGDTLFQADLAHTLEQIKERGRAGFYEGEIAAKIVDEMNQGGGLISFEDLKNYQAQWRKPLIGSYKNHKVITMPPPSSGGLALLQMLKMIEDFPVQQWGWQNKKTVHLMVEIEKRVYADRAKYLGDPDFFDVPVNQLLDEIYLIDRIAGFDKNKITASATIGAGLEAPVESEETTHFSIVDTQGNAVAITTTLNREMGSKVVVNGAGFLLNNEMDDFSIKPGHPNSYGLIGGKANAIEPQKRMLSSMTPTILEKNGELFMVVGTPGGSTIITSVFQTILNVVEYGQTMQQAVSLPRFHHQWLPDTIYTEQIGFDKKTHNHLLKMGYIIKKRSPIGKVDAILRREDGKLEAGADPRGDDAAAFY